MARKEAEEKREKPLTDHEVRLREINDSFRRKKNLHLIGFQRMRRWTEDQKAYLKT